MSSYHRRMTIDQAVLAQAIGARDRLEAAQDGVERARADFNRAVRHLHIAGGTLREIADALGMSHQRVHQLVEDAQPTAASGAPNDAKSDLVSCTFCGKSQKRVKKLIAGPGVYVCEECIVAIHAAVLGREHDGRVTLTHSSPVKCSFCGKGRKKVAWIAQGAREPHARICTECVALCDEIIDEEA